MKRKFSVSSCKSVRDPNKIKYLILSKFLPLKSKVSSWKSVLRHKKLFQVPISFCAGRLHLYGVDDIREAPSVEAYTLEENVEVPETSPTGTGVVLNPVILKGNNDNKCYWRIGAFVLWYPSGNDLNISQDGKVHRHNSIFFNSNWISSNF